LSNNATAVAWGDNTYGQTNLLSGIPPVKLISAGSDHSLAVIFSQLTQYPIDVCKDLLLIYNSNSLDSSNVCYYYLENRPMVSGANVLGIASPGIHIDVGTNGWGWQVVTNTTVYETVAPINFTNYVLNPVKSWLWSNPTKRPEYVILFLDVPSRVNGSATNASGYAFYYQDQPGIKLKYPSVSVQLATSILGWSPLITHINMGDTNACKGYIQKLVAIASTNSANRLLISGSAGWYSNTNYYFDDANGGAFFNMGVTGILASGVSAAAVTYAAALPNTNNVHSGTNVAGYASKGVHGLLPSTYAMDGTIKFYGASGWYLMQTGESFNGMRYDTDQGTFVTWFTNTAFGGTNFANTPAGVPSHTDEPGVPGNKPEILFGLWAAGKNLAISTWGSRTTLYFQAVGDPFVKR
jgi:hypothetical protein